MRCLVGLGVLVAASMPAAAQVATGITADAAPSLTTGTSLSTTGGVTTIAGGARAGANLFHSFNSFSLGAGETARWTATDPLAVSNIVNRVTGGAPSSIAGQIDTTALPNANFFLINPAGVVFTSGAQINVPGAAYFSTAAGGLRFADGQRFSVATPGGSTFSVAAAESFGFVGGEGNVIISGADAGFARLDARLSLTAANIGVLSSTFAPRSLDLVTTGGKAAQIGLADPLAGAPLAGLTVLTEASVFVTAAGGGAPSLRIGTGAFTQSGGKLTSSSFFSGDAGDLVLRAQTADITGVLASNVGENVPEGHGGTLAITVGNLRVGDAGQVSSSTFGRGAAGSVIIRATDVLVEGLGSIGSDSVGARTTGLAGLVQINADSLTVRSGGAVSSTTNGAGDAGAVRIASRTMLLDNGFVDTVTLDGAGRGGLVTIDAGRLELRNGAGIGSFTSGNGQAGNVQVKAGDMSLSSSGNIFSTSLSRSTASGAAGNVAITAADFSMRDSYISSDSSGGGRAGLVSVAATNVTLDNAVLSSSAAGLGNAGDIILAAKTLNVANDSLISSGTSGGGAGGQVSITSDQAVFDFSEVESRVGAGATGAAGTVKVDVGQLTLAHRTEFSSATFGVGAGGQVLVIAKDMLLSGGSDIVARSAASASGAAGQVRIEAGSLHLDGSVISSTTDSSGKAGGVTIAAGALSLDNASSVESGAGRTSTGDGGTVEIAADTVALRSASVIATSTLASGRAGNLNLSAGQLTVDHALLASRSTGAATGAAGNVAITAGSLAVFNDGQIETSSSNPNPAGSITISSLGPVSVSGDNSHLTSENLSKTGGAAGSITIRGGPILVAESGYVSTNSTAGPAGDISLFLPGDSVLRLEGRQAPAVITTSSGPGTGGRIVISNPLAVISNGGEILALGEQRGANVQLSSAYFIRSADRLNRLSVDGSLVVDSQAGDVSAGASVREVAFVDASGVLRGQCRSSRKQGVVSEFTSRPVGPYVAGEFQSMWLPRTSAPAIACR